MKPSLELFELIKSLTKSEKRYFRIKASAQKGSKNYMKLFDVIDSLSTYDEELIRKKYRKEKFVKNFTFNKNYLSGLIFKSLNSYSNKNSIDAKLSSIMGSCKILFEKALMSRYFKTVQTGKEIAEKYEMFTYLLNFLELERQLTKKEDIPKKNMIELYDREVEVIKKMLNINEYNRIVSELFQIQRREGVIRDRSTGEKVEKILHRLQSVNESEVKSLIAKERLLFAKYLANEITGNFDEAFGHNQKRFILISKNEIVFQKFIYDNSKVSMLSLISSAVSGGKIQAAKNYLNKYIKLYGKPGKFELRSETIYNSIRLNEALNDNDKLKLEQTFLNQVERTC